MYVLRIQTPANPTLVFPQFPNSINSTHTHTHTNTYFLFFIFYDKEPHQGPSDPTLGSKTRIHDSTHQNRISDNRGETSSRIEHGCLSLQLILSLLLTRLHLDVYTHTQYTSLSIQIELLLMMKTYNTPGVEDFGA